jgi:putative transport protein
MVEAFIENPILLLFIVAGIGYGVGSIQLRGSGLGVAAVLFVGLIFGSLSPELQIPEIIIFIGLSIFVYTVGLSSGPSFFSLFRQRGSRDLVFIFIMLTFSASVTVLLYFLFGLEASTAAGLFAGSTTNTPALAGLLDQISNTGMTPELKKASSEAGVIGYSLSYPMGVLGPMLAILLAQRILKINYSKEEKELRNEYPVRQDICSITVAIKNEEIVGVPVRDLKQKYNWAVTFGRMERDGEVRLINWDTRFKVGDKAAFVGDRDEVESVASLLGDILPYKLSFDQTEYETNLFFVSNNKIAGQQLSTLNLDEKYAAKITRVTRGDIDSLANSNTVLELGDRVRVLGRRQDMERIAKLFGNSYEELSRINLLSFGLGMALGLMLGMITFELPGGLTFKLGYAGGPVIVGLILGGLRRTGPINWSLPYSANLILRQVGLILLLAGIGVNSGHQFFMTLAQGSGALLFAAGGIISILTALSTLFFGYLVLKIPFSFLTGMVSNQPAILDFALSKAQNKLPNIGFTLMMPISIVTKIVYAQLLFALLN